MSARQLHVLVLRAALAFTWVTACGADVRIEDDDGAGASNVGDGGSNVGATGPGGAGSVGGGDAAPFDVVAACTELCDEPCVGSRTLCVEYCLEDIYGGCEAASIARYAACDMTYCFDDDCQLADDELIGCLNSAYCQDDEKVVDGITTSACEETYDSCECGGSCLEGHTARVACTREYIDGGKGGVISTCLCYFDESLVGECTAPNAACSVEWSCCSGWFKLD